METGKAIIDINLIDHSRPFLKLYTYDFIVGLYKRDH